MNEIKFPELKTYFIAYTDYEVFGYGEVEPFQEMVTGQPNLYKTTNKEDYINELKKFNVTLPEEE
jgi:hypothetical protein